MRAWRKGAKKEKQEPQMNADVRRLRGLSGLFGRGAAIADQKKIYLDLRSSAVRFSVLFVFFCG
jgi:hypothetical protein